MRSPSLPNPHLIIEIAAGGALLGALVFALWPIQPIRLPETDVSQPAPSIPDETDRHDPFPEAAFSVALWTPPSLDDQVPPPAQDSEPPRLDRTLVAIQQSPESRVAVFQNPLTGRLIRLRPGDSISEFSVTEISEYDVAMTVHDRPTTVSLRRTSP